MGEPTPPPLDLPVLSLTQMVALTPSPLSVPQYKRSSREAQAHPHSSLPLSVRFSSPQLLEPWLKTTPTSSGMIRITDSSPIPSLLFTTSGALAQDNANFFWDDTNNRLGIGDVTPDGVLDFDFSSTSTAGASEYGANFTVSDTGVVTIGNTDTTYGTYTSLTRTGASGGTINSYGQYITATGDNGGNSTMYGSYLTATGADTVYGYYASVTGNTSTKSGYYA